MGAIGVVVMTRDRRDELLPTLERLTALPERPPVIVADNGSRDGTVAAVRRRFPSVRILELRGNAGVRARNLAVRQLDTPYVAFSDDDSWWTPGALARVVELFERHPRLGAVTAHVVVDPGGRDDPTSMAMRDSPVSGDPRLPGIPVLGFLACATAVRRSAFWQVGGFEERLHFGGEEELLATDLAAAGWESRYVPDLVVHHEPSTSRERPWRRRREVRNKLWYLWLRRPVPQAARRTWQLLRATRGVAEARGLLEALGGAAWIVRNRRVVPADLERDLRRLDAQPETASLSDVR